jgi:hypothetical protein
MSKPVKLSNASDYEAFLDKYDTFLIDCDGKNRKFFFLFF